MRERRESDLLKSEGGRSFKSCSFGSELNAKPPLNTPTRTSGRGKSISGSTRGKGVNAASFQLNTPSPHTIQTPRHLAEALTGSATSAKEDNHRPRNTERYLGKLLSSGLPVTTVTGGTTNAVLNWMKILT